MAILPHPFSMVVHRQMSEDSGLERFDFLAEDDSDPRAAFLDSLIESFSTRGMVVVYNATFESHRLSDLANWIPTRARQIAAIQARLWDLWRSLRDTCTIRVFTGHSR